MTREDYTLIARALAEAHASTDCADLCRTIVKEGIRSATLCVADALESEDPKFDKALFLKESGFL
jgi:hypothetical protein